MYISKKLRAQVYDKYQGLCAYSGTPLKDDWQVDHIMPLIRGWDGLPDPNIGGRHEFDNMVPCQRIINHYKGSLTLEEFRTWFLGGLHLRLAKLPKNPKCAKSIKRKAYLWEVAELFGISENNPFDSVFYFEKPKP